MRADDVARLLDLAPLPGEGGRFRRTHGDEGGAAIYYLLGAEERSALHRLDVTEVWHHYAGAAARLLLLLPDGGVDEPVLGDDLAAGQRPQVIVPAGAWQGAEPLGEWALVGCTTAPPFRWEGWEAGDAEALAPRWPTVADRIRRLAAS